MDLYSGGGVVYTGGGFIFGMLIGLHILGDIYSGGLYTGSVLTGFYGIAQRKQSFKDIPTAILRTCTYFLYESSFFIEFVLNPVNKYVIKFNKKEAKRVNELLSKLIIKTFINTLLVFSDTS